MWGEHFGPTGEFMAGFHMRIMDGEQALPDHMEITPDTVWQVRGPAAPSAIDMSRREAVIDMMGIDRQLIFPTFALYGMHLLLNPTAPEFLGFDPTTVDAPSLGAKIISAHNTWAVEMMHRLSDRVRPVGMIIPRTIPQMMEEAEELIAGGVRAIFLPAGVPPAGTSPADGQLDPFWSLLAEAHVPLTMHQGSESVFFASSAWWGPHVPGYVQAQSRKSVEFDVDPYNAMRTYYCMEHYIQVMILGGVFERFPDLKVGAIETCAHWVGPLMEKMDLVAENMSATYFKTLSVRPSEYVRRNVRVSPFHFEPVNKYITRYPELADVLCYGSDYPHIEGGRDSRRVLTERLAPLGSSVLESYFVTNGEALLPA
jgi:predicted TIM-barrel fold metal-dependent hydrolase